MKKSFLKNLITLGAVIVLWFIYSLGYLPFGQALDVLTIVVFITVMTLCAEDAADKVLGSRSLITWQYVVLIAFTMACDFIWLYLAACNTVLQLVVRAIMLVAAIGGTFVWAWFAYRISVMSDEERKVLDKSIAYKKLARKFPKMNDEEVREVLEKALFCHLQDDSLEGSLLVGEPFTPEYETLSELSGADSGTDNGTAISIINGYISELIAKRVKKEKS